MSKVNRRNLLKLGLMSLAGLSIFKKSNVALAGECAAPPAGDAAFASPDAGQGKVLQYVLDAKNSKNALYKAGMSCANCNFYKEDKAKPGFGKCVMLANKYVTSCGWCKSYKEKKA